MTLSSTATSYAQALLDDESITDSREDRLQALASSCVSLAFDEPVDPPPVDPPPEETISWSHLTIPSGTPSTINVIRGSVVRGNDTYVSTGGFSIQDAQIWKKNGSASAFTKHSHFNNLRMNCLLVDESNLALYCGMGDQHVMGSARVWKYLANETESQVGTNFSNAEIVYGLCWHDGKLHAGLMTDDTTGAARIMKFDSGTWSNVFAPGLNGVPTSYSYCGTYLTFVFNDQLHAGMFSRTEGHAHVWRKGASGWANLGCPFDTSCYALANIEYDGKLVVAWSADGSAGPIRSRNETTGTWEILGNIPSAWSGANIFNHMCLDTQGRLYVGVGGDAGKLSVWRLNATTNNWEKVAGNGLHGSFSSPIGSGGIREWIYRLQPTPQGTILACVSSASPNGSAGVWEMTYDS